MLDQQIIFEHSTAAYVTPLSYDCARRPIMDLPRTVGSERTERGLDVYL